MIWISDQTNRQLVPPPQRPVFPPSLRSFGWWIQFMICVILPLYSNFSRSGANGIDSIMPYDEFDATNILHSNFIIRIWANVCARYFRLFIFWSIGEREYAVAEMCKGGSGRIFSSPPPKIRAFGVKRDEHPFIIYAYRFGKWMRPESEYAKVHRFEPIVRPPNASILISFFLPAPGHCVPLYWRWMAASALQANKIAY